jgi:hypothetical protein
MDNSISKIWRNKKEELLLREGMQDQKVEFPIEIDLRWRDGGLGHLNDVTSGEVQSIFLVRPNLNGCPEMCP